MSKLSKKAILPIAAVTLLGAGVYGVAQVSAASDQIDPQASLVQKLADKFKLDKAQVQAVFDEEHAAHQAKHEKKLEERLNQAVTDGKLTQAQKDAIVAENKKLKGILEEAKNGTVEERRAAMEKARTEARTWAEQNNLSPKWLMMGMGAHHKGMGGPMKDGHVSGGFGMRDSGERPAPPDSPNAN